MMLATRILHTYPYRLRRRLRQDSNGDGSSGQKCLEQLHADNQHQDEGVFNYLCKLFM